jgi:hypothetical protein
LGLGLAAVWIAGLATGQPAWVSWPNFAFAGASLAVAIMAVSSQRLELTNRT